MPNTHFIPTKIILYSLMYYGNVQRGERPKKKPDSIFGREFLKGIHVSDHSSHPA